MSRYTGAYGRGASRQVRAVKHAEAQARNEQTLPERRAKFRRAQATIRAVVHAFAESMR